MSKKKFILAAIILLCLGAVFFLVYYNQFRDINTSKKEVEATHAVRYQISRNETYTPQTEPEAKTDGVPVVGKNINNETEKAALSDFGKVEHSVKSATVKIEDKVLTSKFIKDLAEVIFEHYIPQEKRLTLTFKQINMRYGLYFYGLNYTQNDILQIRKEIFGHLLRPFIISRLSPTVTNNLTKEIIYIALNRPKEFRQGRKEYSRLLTKDEIAGLLTSLARKVRNISSIFVAYAQNKEIGQLIQEYFEAEEFLKRAYFNYWKLKDKEHERIQSLGREIKQGIVGREKIREQIRLLLASSGAQRGSSEQLYITKWIYRRVNNDKISLDVINALGQAGFAWADVLEQEARKLQEG